MTRRNVLHIRDILSWADAHRQRTGNWPTEKSGAIPEAPGETWGRVQLALREGRRGLSRSSLAKLLAEHRHVRNIRDLPPLSEEQILAWADRHQQDCGKWPNRESGAIAGAPGETWSAMENALKFGRRGLDGGSSLAQLLAKRRGRRNQRGLPRLTKRRIVKWAKLHRQRTGKWPAVESGPIADAPGETWARVDRALRAGYRGLPGNSSVFQLLKEQKLIS